MESDRSQVKLEQILAAAQKRFGHYGLSKTTMNDIANDIGVSKASLYYYFKDKESIFKEVIIREQEVFVEKMRKNIQASFKAEWMLTEYVRMRIELLKKMITLGKFSYGSLLEVKPLISSLMEKFRKEESNMVADILQLGMKSKEFSIDNIHKNAEFFIDTLHSIRKSAIMDYAVGDLIDFPPKKFQKLKEQSGMFVDMFIKGISVKAR